MEDPELQPILGPHSSIWREAAGALPQPTCLTSVLLRSWSWQASWGLPREGWGFTVKQNAGTLEGLDWELTRAPPRVAIPRPLQVDTPVHVGSFLPPVTLLGPACSTMSLSLQNSLCCPAIRQQEETTAF